MKVCAPSALMQFLAVLIVAPILPLVVSSITSGDGLSVKLAWLVAVTVIGTCSLRAFIDVKAKRGDRAAATSQSMRLRWLGGLLTITLCCAVIAMVLVLGLG